MPIGDFRSGVDIIKKEDFKSKYDDLIKEAVSNARPDLEIVRSDEVTDLGNNSTDILTRIMHSDYVIADITYPNANVFYELGLRHASKTGTIFNS